jgi:methyl halide transferase
MDIRRQMDEIYKDMPLDRIPWNLTEPPEMLIKAVESGKIKPCKAVDLGCGAGNYSIWLASHGFDVTGIDISEHAIKHANDLAAEKNVVCDFVAADLLSDLSEYHGKFDLAYDWEVLHHIFPVDRAKYIHNVHDLLKPDAMYLSICFSEKDPDFGGEGKIRKTPLGTELYFSSEEELKELFEPLFHINELTTDEIKGKYGHHLVNAAWLRYK